MTKPLRYAHRGGGWTSADGRLSIERWSAEVGLLTRNVRVQGAEVLRLEVFSNGIGGSAPSPPEAGGAPAPPMPAAGAFAAGGGGAGGLRALLHVMPDSQDGTFSISLMRLVGDTFEFHALFRQLRERLCDITK